MDQSRSQCPLLNKKDEVMEEKGKSKENKYDVKPPRDLRSKYLIKVRVFAQIPNETQNLQCY